MENYPQDMGLASSHAILGAGIYNLVTSSA